MAPAVGIGLLIAENILEDVSSQLFEPIFSMALAAAVGPGWVIIATPTTGYLYVGAQLVVGSVGSASLEVVTVGQVVDGTSFQVKLANAHGAGELIYGATFPVQNTAGDYFFTQSEMLTYLANAMNDFLVECPLAYVTDVELTLGPSEESTALPDDCMQPARVSNKGRSLRETSQANLDAIVPNWPNQAMAPPQAYFRDKIGTGNIGIWPRQADTTELELIYQQRGPQVMGLADGFILPDPFLIYIKARLLSYAYSKDGEQKSPGMAKFFDQRYHAGLQITKVFIEAVMSQDQQ